MYDPTAFTIPEGLNYNDHVVATYLYQTAAKVNIHKLAVALSEEQSSGTWVELPFESDVIRQRHVGKVVAIWEVPDYEDAVPEDVTDAPGCCRSLIRSTTSVHRFRSC